MTRKLFSAIVCFAVGCLVLCAVISAQRKDAPRFALANGRYSMTATYKFSDQESPVANAGTVTVSVKGSELFINIPFRPTPVAAKLSGNAFRGRLQDRGVSIEFSGEVVGNNHTEGVFTGDFGERKVNGLWTMKLSEKSTDERSDS